MRVSLIGDGKMARAVEAAAAQSGHQVVRILGRSDNPPDSVFQGEWVGQTEALIDFSRPDAVPGNVAKAMAAGIPLVEGVTGWQRNLPEVRRIVLESRGCCVHSSNFSVGVQVFFRLVGEAGRLFAGLQGYSPFIEERHHQQKKDAPSGTALALREVLRDAGVESPVSSVRAGYIPGTHEVGFDSAVDTITLTHVARNRSGFAHGALFAAAWVVGKEGFFDFQEVLFHESQ